MLYNTDFPGYFEAVRETKEASWWCATCPLSTLTGKTSANSPRKETVYGKQLKNNQIKE
jgi:hypothetical protein